MFSPDGPLSVPEYGDLNRWLNPDAPAHWLDDVEKWRKANGVTVEHASYEMGFWNVEGNHAYAVISGTLTVNVKGPVSQADWNSRIHIRKAWDWLEDRGASLGAHVVTERSQRILVQSRVGVAKVHGCTDSDVQGLPQAATS
jgi:hypothetical protein